MRLCLLVCRRCSLRCGFCRVNFTGQDMGLETARAALAGYKAWLPAGQPPVVKFFGGEPMLNFGLVRRLVDEAPSLWPSGARFELPTNGLHFDGAALAYLRAHPEVEVTVSQSPEAGAGLPGCWYTMVLDRRCRAVEALAALKRLFSLGYRRFNFLPAYYTPWEAAELSELRRSLAGLAALVKGLRRLDPSVRVKNQEVSGPVPLYNDALTVDVDGRIYASNMVQCEGMEPYREKLLLGRVEDPSPWRIKRSPPRRLEQTIRAWAGPKAWRSTRRVDDLLSEFVGALA